MKMIYKSADKSKNQNSQGSTLCGPVLVLQQNSCVKYIRL